MNIAIVGGSFDPIHNGHIQMGKKAIELLDVDEVWFMPTYSTPLKERGLTLNASRVKMMELALEEYPKFKVCTMELERAKVSYTYDTLVELKQKYPQDKFYWIIGNDQLKQFDQWYKADELVKMAQFVCFDRDGKHAKSKYSIQCLHMPMVPVSSSEIRKGNKLNYVPDKVLDYIYKNELYVEDFVRSRLTDKRFKHSLSVARLSEEIALHNGLDVHLAYMIGLFHDIAKYLPEKEMEKWMDKVCPENKKYAFAVWHGFVGAEVCKAIFGLTDSILYEAIYHHVLGTSTNVYAKIVFCADKLDPLRGYDSSAMIEACKKGIHSGFEWVTLENKKYLERG